MPYFNAPVNYTPTTYPQYYLPDKKMRNGVRTAGAAIIGGIVGMSGYYLPIKKSFFVNEAFNVYKNKKMEQIQNLKQAAVNLTGFTTNLSQNDRIFLNNLGVSPDINSITDKAKVLEEEITDINSVKNIKKYFADNFVSFKKNAHLMDNTAYEAMRNLKWNGFKWGSALCAAFGVGVCMLSANKRQ